MTTQPLIKTRYVGVADWQTKYAHKVQPIREVLRRIRPGDRVFIGSACGEPPELMRQLMAGSADLVDVELVQVLTLGGAPYAEPRFAGSLRANTFFIGSSLRHAVNMARADYTPAFLSQVPRLFQAKRVDLGAALVMVSPPDEHGYVSLGVSVDVTKAAIESARMVIAQVNACMPRTLGDTFIHIDQIHCLLPHDEPLLEWPRFEDHDPDVRRIATQIARLIPDGATLQLGIGRIPDAVAGELIEKNDLGIHTEMFSDGVIKLARAGVITGKYKTLHPRKIVASFAAGSSDLFDYIHDNPMIEMHPSDYTNSPRVISGHDNMIAINAAIEVDLTGQVCADSVGTQFFSGMGGHADFIRGAAFAQRGKPIIALPSTARMPDGSVRSRIVAILSEGAGVVTTRGDVHYVVTEYGVAYLHGKTLRERAMSLIGVAHPDFRAELLHAAKHRHIVYADQILPPPRLVPSPDLDAAVMLRSGAKVTIRAIRPDDEPLMKDMFYSFGEQTVYLRFHHAMKALPHQRLQVFCNVDFETEVNLVAVAGEEDDPEIIALACYYSEVGSQEAEVAFAVADAWQRKGLGTHLFKRLVDLARARGMNWLTADVLVENSGMLKLFHQCGLPIETNTDSGVVRVRIQLAQAAGKEQEPEDNKG